jgi:molybdopterin/thiamine biosynthesis adenylyltransferase
MTGVPPKRPMSSLPAWPLTPVGGKPGSRVYETSASASSWLRAWWKPLPSTIASVGRSRDSCFNRAAAVWGSGCRSLILALFCSQVNWAGFDAFMELDSDDIRRYSRHLNLPEVGLEGQKKICSASVLCLGAGGLGSPVALYLAAAGVGKLGIVDYDAVDVSNLQRQVLHGTPDVGRPKTQSAKETIQSLNPKVEVVLHDARLSSKNALDIIRLYDIVVDGTDNFPTRYLANDACVLLRKPNVYGAVFRFEGQASLFAPHLGGPCYRCLYPEPPPPGAVPSCAEGGVLGVLPGIIGLIQATETLKLILGQGSSLLSRLLLFDALEMRFRELKLRRDPQCPVCGEHPTITELIDYEAFCGSEPPSISAALHPDEVTV